MKKFNKGQKYNTDGSIEDQYEWGSKDLVLKNLLGIKNKEEMDQLEYQEQLRALDDLIKIYGMSHRFTEKDVCRIHKVWLGRIYSWAGQYRHVNMTKNGFTFAGARVIPDLMQNFEKEILTKFTPCHFKTFNEIIHALAVVHAEFVLIHPFREGNGRLGRLLVILMGLQAQLPPLDFGELVGEKRQEYFRAVRAGLDKNYEPMEKVFTLVVRGTRKKVNQR